MALSKDALPLEEHPEVVLFNISAPWREFINAKLRAQKVVIRVDGLYFDRLSPNFIARFWWPFRVILRLGLIFRRLHDPLAHVANMLDENYKSFLRILLADHLIFQSRFSMQIHQVYFPRKPYSIVVNGAKFITCLDNRKTHEQNEIRLITIYDEWRHSKRLYELLRFVCWLNENERPVVTLMVLGYSGKTPEGAPSDMKRLLEGSDYIRTLPRFGRFDGPFREALSDAHCFITFSFRDSCPNAVVEAMAHGLPVVGLTSGGLPDIVGDAGRLVPADDFAGGFFSAHRFEMDFPSIDFEQVSAALHDVLNDLPGFRDRVTRRFSEQLDITMIANQYQTVLEQLA